MTGSSRKFKHPDHVYRQQTRPEPLSATGDIVEGTDSNIQTMGKEELIKAVIAKHEQYIATYTAEFEQLAKTVDTRNSGLESGVRKSAEADVSQKEIAEEKKNMYADAVIKELEALKESLGSVSQDDVSRNRKDIEKIIDEVKNFNSQKKDDTFENKEKQYNAAADDIEGLDTDAGKAKEIRANLDNAFEACKVLYGILEDENAKKAQMKAAAEAAAQKSPAEAKSDAKRYEWLGRRILSHKDALEYWKGI